MWAMLDGGRDYGVRIVPFGSGREEIRIPWSGLGNTAKLWQNLLDCVRTRETPMCPIDMAVRVQAPLSMANLSYIHNKVAMFDFEKQSIVMN